MHASDHITRHLHVSGQIEDLKTLLRDLISHWNLRMIVWKCEFLSCFHAARAEMHSGDHVVPDRGVTITYDQQVINRRIKTVETPYNHNS